MSQCVDSEIVFISVIKRELHTFVYYCMLKNWSTKIQQILKFKGMLAAFMPHYSMKKIGDSFIFI